MIKAFEQGGVAAAGLITSIFTALIVTVFHRYTGFNLFSFSLWFVVPAGAVLCGFAAASGYYLAARYLHMKPSRYLLIQMVVIAAITQLSIYYLEYFYLAIDGMRAKDVISFSGYLDLIFTKTHMKVGRGHFDTGEVGAFGYWLAFSDFIGFLAGAAFVYFSLKSLPSCKNCSKYFDKAGSKKDSFINFDEFSSYYNGVYAHPVDSLAFSEHVIMEYSAGKAQQGTVNLETKILQCPSCEDQIVVERAHIFNGKEWKEISELNRAIAMPSGLNVRPAFGV
jgi:hypothetical protein